MARKLQSLGVKRIYASPSLRAKETAEIIARDIKAEIIFLPSLRSVSVDIGKVGKENLTKKNWIDNFPGFESPNDFIKRTKMAIKKILREHGQQETILLVGHEETLWAMWKIFALPKIDFSDIVEMEVAHCDPQIFILTKENVA